MIGRPHKFDWGALKTLLNDEDGKKMTDVQIAKKLNITAPAVRYARKQILDKKAVCSLVSFEHGQNLVANHLDTVSQLKNINEQTTSILNLIMDAIKGDKNAIDILNQDDKFKRKDPNEIALKAVAEIREQLELQNKLFETLYSIQQTQEFQEEVLSVLESFEPGIRTKILIALKEKRLLHAATQWKDSKK
jgi:hypothetical protein